MRIAFLRVLTGVSLGTFQRIMPYRARKCDLHFTFSTHRVKPVAVSKRPFFSSYTTSLWVRFLRFSLISYKKLESDLEKLDLTPPQFYVLATIGYAGGLPFGEIGAKMMVTVSNLTGIVDRPKAKKIGASVESSNGSTQKGWKSAAPAACCAALVMVMGRQIQWKMFPGQKPNVRLMNFIASNDLRRNRAGSWRSGFSTASIPSRRN